MPVISCPATSANIGPGFDCMGLALDLYDRFLVSLSEEDQLIGIDEKFKNPDNLFLKAFHAGCEAIGSTSCVRAEFACDIPFSRGLGSSAAMVCGGVAAASILHDDALSDEEIFQIAARLEGHPDNAAPCVFGGLTTSMEYEGKYLTCKLPFNQSLKLTLLIPDAPVDTRTARAMLPESYPLSVAAGNTSKAIMICKALETGNINLLKAAARDEIHEPYRRTLIKDFDKVKEIAQADTGGVLFISGSGSTCLLISPYGLSPSAKQKIKWQVKETKIALHGIQIQGDALWHQTI